MTRSWRNGVLAAVTVVVPLMSPAAADPLLDLLEASLNAGKIPELAAIVRDHAKVTDLPEIIDWLRRKVDSGQAPDNFARLMVAFALRNGDKDQALMYLSYYRALIIVDGSSCPDPSSPGSLLEQTIFLPGKLDSDKSISVERKRDAIDRALVLEQATSSTRKRDPSLCEAGLTAYAKALDVPLTNGSDGKAKEAATPLGRTPYAGDPTWVQKRDQTLKQLRRTLLFMNGATSSP